MSPRLRVSCARPVKELAQMSLFDVKPIAVLACFFGAPWPCGPCDKCAKFDGD